MKSLQTLLLSFVVLGLIGSINFDFPYSDELGMHINVRDDGDDDLRRLYGFYEETDDVFNPDDRDYDPTVDPLSVKDVDDDSLDEVRVRAFIPDLGVMVGSQPFDIDGHETKAKWLYVYDSQDLCDEWVRISVSSDEARRTKYRQIIC